MIFCHFVPIDSSVVKTSKRLTIKKDFFFYCAIQEIII